MPPARPWQLVTAVTAVAGLAAIGIGLDRSGADPVDVIDLDDRSSIPVAPVPIAPATGDDDRDLITPDAPLVSPSSTPTAVSADSPEEAAEPTPVAPADDTPDSPDSPASAGSIDSD